jgi:hypothetical protein
LMIPRFHISHPIFIKHTEFLNHTIDPVNPQLDPTVIQNSTAKL